MVFPDNHGQRQDGGFTLVELAVAMVVLVVLVGLAIPTFLGTRAGAEDEVAKSAALTALKAHQIVYSDGDGYGDLATAEAAEPNVVLDELPAVTDPDEMVPKVLGVVFVRSAGDEVVLVSRSRSGWCFWARGRGSASAFAKNQCTSPPQFTTSW